MTCLKSQKEEFASRGTLCSFYDRDKTARTEPDNRPEGQVKLVMTENCSSEMNDGVSVSFHVALPSASLSRSLCLYPDGPLEDVATRCSFGYRKKFKKKGKEQHHTFHMLSISCE